MGFCKKPSFFDITEDMKKLLTILSLVLLVSCSDGPPPEVFFYELDKRQGVYYHDNSNTPFTGSSVNYYEDGLRVENGKPQVNYTELMFRRNYKNGKKDGLSEGFYENGQLESRENYKNGIQNGLSEIFHENGQIWIRENYKNGKQDGLSEMYGEDGSSRGSSCYKNDKSVDMSYCED